MSVAIAIFAHQEERRIAACLDSLPLDRPATTFHVLVNGSTDRTVERARAAAGDCTNVIIQDLHPGGKARTWNHLVHTILTGQDSALVCLDGDARIAPGSIDALIAALAADPAANAAAGMPLNGRQAEAYRRALHAERGLFGDLYALSGRFVAAIRDRSLYLPSDLIGDDGLVAAWSHTDLQTDAHWQRDRIIACDGAGFLCDPVSLLHPSSWTMQYRRMINYSVRFFQNRIISDIMAREGPNGLPKSLADVYPAYESTLLPRPGIVGWFDRRALARLSNASSK